jgi:long-chain acyl-CoA synthetase
MNSSDHSAAVQSLRDILCFGARQFGDRPALGRVSGAVLTYSELLGVARNCADYLVGLGVSPGDRVGLLSENSPEWGAWYLAITAMGATVLPILTDFHPAEVQRILEHSEPSVLVVSDRLRRLIGDWAAGAVVSTEVPSPGAATSPTDVFAGERNPDDIAAIIYTSGTTGNPKGVMLSHRNIVSNAIAAKAIPTITPDDTMLSILPLAHSYECTIGFVVPLAAGASVMYLDGPPVLSRLLPALAQVRPTLMLSVPLVMEKIYRARVVPVFEKLPSWVGRFAPTRKVIHRIAAAKVKRTFGGRIRFFGLGGAPVAPDAERFLYEGGFPYAIGYGLTETAPLLAGASPQRTKFRSTGPALEGVELRLAPATASADGSVGEIQARGPNIMRGYYKNPIATAEAFTEDGWFRTGDLGSIDSHGYVFIRGRAKTMILGPSGENIYPEDIEAAIDANVVVEESLVLQAGGELIARVRLNIEELARRIGTIADNIDLEALRRDGATVLEDLRRQVNEGLNRFSRVGKMILQEDPLERTPTRKIKRFLYQTHAPDPG